ncbi:hypothetical protein [Hymenobacter sp. BRD67]|uniref:hypothetical protein n=1 Tax=Hymenobacter sp. BRD67 TaxID=2675877 RepID=UPI00156718A9|nr:hypothetical protein [Hymenobacter sp. BRD67]QKG53520.1 hypothetical protein GKZ67_14090 [Hymenobacter sp. BRD67]
MKNLFCSVAAFCGLLAVSAPLAQAQDRTPAINARQAQERNRIRQGVRSGELTRPEAARLRGREARIGADKRAARADGVVTRGERQEIRHDEQRTSRAIYNQKHDRQVRRY